MTVRLLTEHHLEFISLKGGCTGSSVSTVVKIPHYWKSHVMAHVLIDKKALNQYWVQDITVLPTPFSSKY